MEIVQIYTDSPLRNFTYLILDETEKKALVIDPFYPSQVLEWAQNHNFTLQSIINTHEHNDHVCGNEGLIPHIEEDILCHPHARSRIHTSTRSLALGERFKWGNGWVEVWDTPGHTMNHISLVVGYKETVYGILTGDTLFNAGVGNCKKGGDPLSLYDSVFRKILTLPDHVKVYPGHDYFENNLSFTLSLEPENLHAKEILEDYKSELKKGKFLVSTLGMEKDISLFFRLDKPAIRSWAEKISPGIALQSEKLFLELRKLRDSW